MSNIELQRDHAGGLSLFVAGQYAVGTKVTGIQQIGEDLSAVVVIPLKALTVAEQRNVIPFVRPPNLAPSLCRPRRENANFRTIYRGRNAALYQSR